MKILKIDSFRPTVNPLYRWLLYTLLLAFMACSDDGKFVHPPDPEPGDTLAAQGGIYICSEGLINLNNSSLAYYSFVDNKLTKDFFNQQNKRGLGDTANELVLYGGRLYCVVSGSNVVDVIDAVTGISIKQIKLIDENKKGRQPRKMAFYGNKAYVCSFDGTVIKLDTLSLEIEGIVKVGTNPDGICITNGKAYVSNSGGLNFPNYDNTVSVIELSTFTELKKIRVATNPFTIKADDQGDVYVASKGNYNDVSYQLQRIDSRTDEVVQDFATINVLNFTIHKDTAYIYNYDFDTQQSWIKMFDCKTESFIREDFITDGTKVNTPFGISVNPYNGDVYITDALDFTKQGSVFCFGNNGKQKFKLSQVGLNPNSVVFVR